MSITSPRNSRDKRLHVVFFTDASKTKSTSISLRNLALLVAGLCFFFSTAGISLYLYKNNHSLLGQKNEYIRELKSSIAAYAVINERTQLSMANEIDPQTDLTRKVAQEIQNPSAVDRKAQPGGSDNTLASLQSSLSSLSTVSASLARNEKNPPRPIDFAESRPPAMAELQTSDPDKSLAAKDAKAVQSNDPSPKSALTGVQVEQQHTTEFNGQTTLHFQLVNTSPSRGRTWTGRVCGVAELATTQNAQKAGQAGLIAIPSGEPVKNSQNPIDSCADGELVRFSRLRPTELIVPARQDSIKRITVFFVESGSNRTLTQQIEL